VRSVAGAPSSGRRWTKSVMRAAVAQDGSSSRPSIVGGFSTRAGFTAGLCAKAVPLPTSMNAASPLTPYTHRTQRTQRT
jgi:hypothetical protein